MGGGGRGKEVAPRRPSLHLPAEGAAQHFPVPRARILSMKSLAPGDPSATKQNEIKCTGIGAQHLPPPRVAVLPSESISSGNTIDLLLLGEPEIPPFRPFPKKACGGPVIDKLTFKQVTPPLTNRSTKTPPPRLLRSSATAVDSEPTTLDLASGKMLGGASGEGVPDSAALQLFLSDSPLPDTGKPDDFEVRFLPPTCYTL